MDTHIFGQTCTVEGYMEIAKKLAASEDSERVMHALDNVFRRLLANLLLDYSNPKFRKVRVTNAAITRSTEGLTPAFVTFLFTTLGFTAAPDAEGFVEFSGTEETLRIADKVFSSIEDVINEERNKDAIFLLRTLTHGKGIIPERSIAPVTALKATAPQSAQTNPKDDLLQTVFTPEDFASVQAITPVVTKTLLTTGRVRNCFFEGKGLTVRRMEHGRVFACSEKCANNCLEAHWHLHSGKGMMYAYVAHLSPDGTALLHMGAEHGYQYNTMPGTPNFGKTVHFTEKLVKHDGTLAYNKHPDKVATTCIYCNELFSKLFL